MARITGLCMAAALAGLISACGTVPVSAVRSGTGVVEQVRHVGMATPELTTTYAQSSVTDPRAVGGGRLPDRSAMTGDEVQLSLRMDDGSHQVVAHGNPNFRRGDRVRITQDGKVIRL